MWVLIFNYSLAINLYFNERSIRFFVLSRLLAWGNTKPRLLFWTFPFCNDYWKTRLLTHIVGQFILNWPKLVPIPFHTKWYGNKSCTMVSIYNHRRNSNQITCLHQALFKHVTAKKSRLVHSKFLSTNWSLNVSCWSVKSEVQLSALEI